MKHLLFLLFVIFISCKSESNQVASNQDSNIVEIPEEFIPFYERFHSDSVFQLNHIVFPLKESSDSTMWLKENWLMHLPFNDMQGEFVRSFDNINGIMIEKINQKNGFVEIERRFGKVGDDYSLIYYKITSQFGQ